MGSIFGGISDAAGSVWDAAKDEEEKLRQQAQNLPDPLKAVGGALSDAGNAAVSGWNQASDAVNNAAAPYLPTLPGTQQERRDMVTQDPLGFAGLALQTGSDLMGMGGKVADQELPQSIPDYVRQPLVTAAGIAPGFALGPESLATKALMTAGSAISPYVTRQAAQYGQRQGGMLGGVGDVLQSSAGPLGTVGDAFSGFLGMIGGAKLAPHPDIGYPPAPQPFSAETAPPRPFEPTPTVAAPDVGYTYQAPRPQTFMPDGSPVSEPYYGYGNGFAPSGQTMRTPDAVDPLRPPEPLASSYSAGVYDASRNYKAQEPWSPPTYDGSPVPPDQESRLQAYRQGLADAQANKAGTGTGAPPNAGFTPPPPPSGISAEAQALLDQMDRGGAVPGFVSKNMERIALENGIPQESINRMTPNQIIDELRARSAPPPSGAGVEASGTSPPYGPSASAPAPAEPPPPIRDVYGTSNHNVQNIIDEAALDGRTLSVDEATQLARTGMTEGPTPRTTGDGRVVGSQPPADWANAGKPPPGSIAAAAPTPPSGGIWDTIKELLYLPFGGDISNFRQNATMFFNPRSLLNGEAKQSLELQYQALTNAGGKRAAMDAIKAKVPDGINMHWAGEGPTGRETMRSGIVEKVIPGAGRLADVFDVGINAARALHVEKFVERNPNASKAAIQTWANYTERLGGRGTFGSMEKSLSSLGPMFTSLRMMASIPQRASYLLPWTKLADGSMQIMGPVWRGAVVDHAGFIATIAAAMEIAKGAGLKIGDNPLQQSRDAHGNPGFGKVRVGNTDFDLTFGQGRYVNAVMQAATGQKNGKDYPAIIDDQGFKGGYRGTIADFLRNSAGPIPGAAFAGAKALGAQGKAIDYLRPDYWDKGVLGKGTPIDKIAQFVTPLWIQDVADAYNAAKDNKIGAAVAAGVPAFFGAGVQSIDPSTAETRNAALTPDTLSKAFPDSPTAQRILQGKDWNELLPSEKAQLTPIIKAQDPSYWADFEKKNREDNPATAKHGDTIDALQARKTALEDRLLDLYNKGQLDKPGVRNAMFTVQRDYFAQKDQADKDPEYQRELAALKANGTDPSQAQRALDAYYAIGQHYEDRTQAKDAQTQFLKTVYQNDPELAARLVGATHPRNQTGLEKLYASGALVGR